MDACCTLRKRANTKPKNPFHWIRKIDTYVQKKKGKTKQANNVKSKWECCFLDIYISLKFVVSQSYSQRWATSRTIVSAFGGAIETPVTTSTSSPSTSTWTSASGAVTFSDAPQSYTRYGKARAKLQPRRRNATQHTTSIQNWRTTWN